MVRLRTKLALFNLLSKVVFTGLFLLLTPYIIERITLMQVDNDLIQKREQVIDLILRIGIEPFRTSDNNTFGSYNILKEEFISLEKTSLTGNVNYIEVTRRLIEGDEITYRVLNYTFKVNGEKYLLEVGKSLTSIFHTRKNIEKVMLVFLAFIILITFLTDLLYTRYSLRPLDKITNKLKGISDPSIFDKTPVITTTSDFQNLDYTLRELMSHIEELFQREKEITVNISHEMLTPISVLRSKLENLLLRKNIEPEVSNKIEESLKTLHRLQALVNSFLLIARIENRQYLREDSFSVAEVLKEIISEISPIADDTGIVIREELTKDFRFDEANKSLIFSMFYNVVNNAVKNTPSGGEVLIKSSFNGNNYVITIKDTGKGMSEAQMDVLFSRFRARLNDNGTGIGLSISKSIADFHGIKIIADSVLQKGTTFSFIFPENS